MQDLHENRRVVPEAYAQMLYEYLEAQGRVPEHVLGAPWPSPDSSGLGGIDEHLWSSMLERAERELEDPYLALHLGETINSRHLGVMGAVLPACDNLAGALRLLVRYQRLLFDTVPMTPRSVDGSIELVWDTYENRTSRLVDEVGLAVLVRFCRSIVRVPVNPVRVDFTHVGPGDISPYEEYFGCPVGFQRPELVLQGSLELMNAPLKTPDPALIRVLEQHADQLLRQLPTQQDIVVKVRKAIAGLLCQGEPSIETVSRSMNCHSRKLQRELKLAGTTFRDELQAVRHQFAESYLRDRRLQILDVAMLLGFSEHSAFTRSFRKWTGRTPAEFRQENKGAEQNEQPD
ncbi:AraC family transcriptional regulator [Marinobacter mobilis]|uniref:AraC-type DNA-binding protein n=1 Tax=Marinobacter mobilis TaxID=488533 RepID=A0A1H2ZEL7_9GAMM|nr:AraC family transcriptional regulator [Marinobacter mobilis]SDX15418.1 AraC-type DNA-binding protein [Marinobacter mobilis]